MQDVDRPSHVQPLPEPAGAGRPRGEAEALRVVTRAERVHGMVWHRGRRRHLRQRAAVRPSEAQGPVGPARDPISLFVHSAVMQAAQQGEIRERGRAPVRPVPEVMPLSETDAAAREAAAPVPMVERSQQGGGNRPGPGLDLQQAPGFIMAHHHPAGVARQAPGRFRGNACAVFQDRLARLIQIGQHLGVDVDHHLVALARGAGIESLVEGGLGEEGQRVGLLLGQRGRFL